ncbi:MAG: MurNAc alpha-1-phosphate uridylyltransferase [Halieaceae bacterium]|jgi:MurNAc alpha-1-phosphate uridylyltransferase
MAVGCAFVKAMILAAGVGARMRPLTDVTPKPLLQVAGKPLIHYHLEALASAGFEQVVINVSHLGQQIIDALGSGEKWGLQLIYSAEDTPLETAGGIVKALPLLDQEPFLIVNGDVFTDYPFAQLRQLHLPADTLGHLVMVANPAYHTAGDFGLSREGLLHASAKDADQPAYTYAGIAVYSVDFFAGVEAGPLPMRPLLDRAIVAGRLRGECYAGSWYDIGTPQRLSEIDARYTV